MPRSTLVGLAPSRHHTLEALLGLLWGVLGVVWEAITAAWGLCSDVYEGVLTGTRYVLWRPARRPARAWTEELLSGRVEKPVFAPQPRWCTVSELGFVVSGVLYFASLRVVVARVRKCGRRVAHAHNTSSSIPLTGAGGLTGIFGQDTTLQTP